MTKIFIFPAGTNDMMFPEYGGRLWSVASAVTDKGRMLAGALSGSEQTALERCLAMAKQKAPEMLSDPELSFEIVNPDDVRLHKALDEYFKRMP